MTDLELWLVNDDPAQLLVQKRLLGRFAATVWGFSSPTELLAQARKFGSCPNLVSDYHMPDMDGAELSRLWCEMHPDAKVLLLSVSKLSRAEKQQSTYLPSTHVKVLTDFRIPELLSTAKAWFSESAVTDEESFTPVAVGTYKKLEHFEIETHHRLQQLGGVVFLVKALTRFRNKTPERIEEIKKAIDSENFKQVHTIAHALKGSCGIVGATNLSVVADALELSSQESEPMSLLLDGLFALESAWEATLLELEDVIKPR